MFCLRDLAATRDADLQYLTRTGWLACTVLAIPVGGIFYPQQYEDLRTRRVINLMPQPERTGSLVRTVAVKSGRPQRSDCTSGAHKRDNRGEASDRKGHEHRA